MKVSLNKKIIAALALFLAVSCQNHDLTTDLNDIRQLEQETHDISEGIASADAQSISDIELIDPVDSEDSLKAQSTFKLDNSLKHLDPNKVIPRAAFEKSLTFFQTYRSRFKNQNYLGIIDVKQKSTNKRFYLVNLKTGQVERFLVSHGKYSDTDHDGYATSFSNVNGSGKTSLGAYMTAEHYYGKYGKSMRLDGLQSTNSNARKRAVVMHEATYVNPYSNPLGRSLGCPAVEKKYKEYIIQSLKAGAMLYIHY